MNALSKLFKPQAVGKPVVDEQPAALAPSGPVSSYASLGLEAVLVALCTLGSPKLLRMEKGWWCYMDMHVSAVGATFTIRSESDCPTPLDAARQCAARAVEAQEKYQKA